MRLLKKIPIHPSFYLVFLWFMITGQTITFLSFLFCLLIHELGHYIIAKKLKYKLSNFYLAPYGAALNYKESCFLPKDEVIIALAGPLSNIFFSVLIIALWWIYPSSFSSSYELVTTGLALAIFNLIPAYPLDGGRILVGALSEKISRKKTLKLAIIFNLLFSCVFLILFLVTCFINYNPTFALFSVFLLAGIWDCNFEGKYQQLNIYNKKIKNLSSVKLIYVLPTSTLGEMFKAIDTTKLTVFLICLDNGKTLILTEKKVLSLCMKHSIKSSIQTVLFN